MSLALSLYIYMYLYTYIYIHIYIERESPMYKYFGDCWNRHIAYISFEPFELKSVGVFDPMNSTTQACWVYTWGASCTRPMLVFTIFPPYVPDLDSCRPEESSVPPAGSKPDTSRFEPEILKRSLSQRLHVLTLHSLDIWHLKAKIPAAGSLSFRPQNHPKTSLTKPLYPWTST